MKINNLKIKGLRGVKTELVLNLQEKSALFYGDNGTGKSTIADVLEWFYYDKVDYLTGNEIGRDINSIIQNITLSDNEKGFVQLSIKGLSDEHISKTTEKASKATTVNTDVNVAEYIKISQSENFILRYRDLNNFIVTTQAERLNKLSVIIGYSEVTKVRKVLKETYSQLQREIKGKNFPTQIALQQSIIMEQFKCNITSDEQFIQATNKLLEPLDLSVSCLQEINGILKTIKQPDDSQTINQESCLNKINEKLVLLPDSLTELEKQYDAYKEAFETIALDIDKLRKLLFEKLLSAGKEILEDNNYIESKCPLCLTSQNKEVLLDSIKHKLNELEAIRQEQKKLAHFKDNLSQQADTCLRHVSAVLTETVITNSENTMYKTEFGILKSKIEKYKDTLKIKPSDSQSLENREGLIVDKSVLAAIQKKVRAELSSIQTKRKGNPKLEAYHQIKSAGHAYTSIKNFEKEDAVYKTQLDAMERIYKIFLAGQKKALKDFFDTFSNRINEICEFLNLDNKIENIKLVPVGNDDELTGITIEFDFMDNTNIYPPHKYLSESYLNRIGIAFFLASVEAFNKTNKFIVLDDVISSFDVNHRKRFGDLLIEQYKDYQLIVLTHENFWFKFMQDKVRGKDWLIKNIKHNSTEGTYMDKAEGLIKERIEAKIEANNSENLAPDVRTYLEAILKNIASELEIPVPFRFNDKNEDRMSDELLSAIKGRLNKKSPEIAKQPIFERLTSFIGNKGSHNNNENPCFADTQAFWQDVCEFENLFFCKDCQTYISLKNYSITDNKIYCKKQEKSLLWKK
ncbi:MAG: hypothetical protein K0U45_03475 [Alphaproteobacteria bacterium]|nr:hypothetical protein [Alphaproteobacteria bacterium]